MLNDHTSLHSYLSTRRSARPRDLVAPGPGTAELDAMLAIAARTPDHGKLAPWRFVIVSSDARDRLAETIIAAYRAERPQAAPVEIEALRAFAHHAPTLVVVLSNPRPEHHIPVWEQELSAGAVCMNLLHAANAFGFAGGWVTGWPAYSSAVRDAFAAAPERVAGFLYIGTLHAQLEDRPRPDLDKIITRWEG